MQQADFNGVPKPGQVMVGQFAYAANDPTPDQSIMNRMMSQYVPSEPQTPAEQFGQTVAQTMQNALIKDLGHEGITSVATLNNILPPPGTMLVEGELLTAQPGGGYQRLAPGLGAGQAKVVSFVSVYLVTTKGPVSFAKFYSDTKGSNDVTTNLTVGSAASGVANAASPSTTTLARNGQGAQADAKLIAKQIAKKMQKLFAAETWLSPNSPN